MANFYNFWAGISAAFQTEMVDVILNDGTAVTFPELNNLSEDTKDLFRTVYDHDNMDRLYRKWGGADYRCWNCYSTKPTGAAAIRAELDSLAAAYPTDFSILGAWNYDTGAPVGTGGGGDPWYLQPAQTINFMPDIVDPNSPDPDDPDMIRPTELSNVQLIFGQAPRVFTEAP